MNPTVLALTYQGTLADNASTALKMTLLGLGAVFAALALLWAVLCLFKLFFHDLPAKREKEREKEEEPVSQAPAQPAAQDDAELVAVLSTAVAAVLAGEREQNPDLPPTGFRVVSYKRMNQGMKGQRK